MPLSSNKLPLPMGGSGPPSNTWFPRPTRVLNPNGISIGSAIFAQLTAVSPGTLAPPGEYGCTCASLCPPKSITRMANQSVQPFLHCSWQKVPILYNGRSFPPKLPLLMGDLDPHLTHGSLGPHESSAQMASRSVQQFSHGSLVS